MHELAEVKVAVEIRARATTAVRRLQGPSEQGRGRLLRSLRYATDLEGNRANMAYNAETLEKLDNAEAGEN